MRYFYNGYLLKSEKDGNNYIGYTSDLKERITLHNAEKVSTTKNVYPLSSYILKDV